VKRLESEDSTNIDVTRTRLIVAVRAAVVGGHAPSAAGIELRRRPVVVVGL